MSDTKTTVILPIHKMDETITSYLDKAIKSIENQKVKPEELLIVTAKGVTVNEDLLKNVNHRIVVNEGNSDFCSQINFGVENVKTTYFSILEVDDEYSKIWFDNVVKYSSSYEDVDVFLPIVLDVNTEGRFLHFTNEPVWAKEFSDKLGFLDNDALLNFPNFQLSGAVIKVEAFKAVGGLKPSIKLHFIYEILLRMSYYDKKMMTIPKLGYKKTNMRPDSLFFNYYNIEEEKIDVIEARFWFNTSRKECYFKQDRNIKFDRENATIL
jgi:glycosyltransferase involved in cell wall biosynthesis